MAIICRVIADKSHHQFAMDEEVEVLHIFSRIEPITKQNLCRIGVTAKSITRHREEWAITFSELEVIQIGDNILTTPWRCNDE